ncbi:MAG: HNH endonuclease [Bacilli bacterium]
MEQWKDYKTYQISNHGRVRSYRHGKVYTRSLSHGRGYARVEIENVTCYLHRLVAELFVPNPDNLDNVTHIDGNKRNNHASNLTWTTMSAVRRTDWGQRDESAFDVTRTISNACKVAIIDSNGVQHESMTEAARYYNISYQSVYNSLRYERAVCGITFKRLEV